MPFSDTLTELSAALAARGAFAGRFLAAVTPDRGPPVTGVLWSPDTVIVSEQRLHRAERATVRLTDGTERGAALFARDPGTNIGVFRLSEAAPADPLPEPVAAAPGALAVLAATGPHGPTLRLAAVRAAGPAWVSQAGGRIDARIELDLRIGHREDGGAVFSAAGGLLGAAAAGPRGEVLVIPVATIARTLELLASGRPRRGWVGLELQPVLVPETLRAEARADAGLMVMRVAEQGPGAAAGILPGDLMLAWNGRALDRVRRLSECLGPDSVDATATVLLARGGDTRTVTVTVRERPASP
jgi:S1-C subfamily serine protease